MQSFWSYITQYKALDKKQTGFRLKLKTQITGAAVAIWWQPLGSPKQIVV